jgi:MarR family transcriptional regulator, organic hydroperoxide resistance regulator
MTDDRLPTTIAFRDVQRICRPSHPAVRAWLGWQHQAARTERLLGAALRRHGLNHGQLAVLLTIGTAEGLTQQDLADRLGLTEANVSQVLDRLEAAGLVRRVPEARAYALHLTDESRLLLAAAVPEQEALIVAQFAELTPDEQEQLRRLIERLVPDVS